MKLIQIQTFDSIFFTGIGELGKTINDSREQKVNKFPGLTLEVVDNVGIKISCMGRFYIAPWAAIKGAIGRVEGSAAETVQQGSPIRVKAVTSATGS